MSNELVFTATTPAGDILTWAKSGMQPNIKYVLTRKKWQKKRTLDQNAQSFVWYKQIAEQLPDYDAKGWARYCKLVHGVPILRSEDAEFRAFYDKAIKLNLDYEEKMQAMDYTPVSRLMNTNQFNRYFEAIQEDFLKRGVVLQFLNDAPIYGDGEK